MHVRPEVFSTSSGSQEVTVEVQASDNLSGTGAVEVNLSNGSRWFTAAAKLSEGTGLSGTWTATLTLPSTRPKVPTT